MSKRLTTRVVGSTLSSVTRRNFSSYQRLQLTSVNYRSEFTKFFNDPTNMEKASGVTWHTVGMMNYEMERNNVPMTQAHFEVATESLRRGDTICTFLASENKHVLSSTGSGVVYDAGYKFHELIGSWNSPDSDD